MLAGASWRNVPPMPTGPRDPFPIARQDEVEILHIDGDDLASVVVGRLPLVGAIELAEPGEVEVTSLQPAHGDNMTPMVPRGRPMIWAKLETE